jgi:deoxyribodipyrimidine photo-lyase
LWNSTLSHPRDVPDNLFDRFPQSYTAFRKKTEHVKVQKVFPTPKQGDLPELNPTNELELSAFDYMPDLKVDFEFSDKEIEIAQDPRSVLPFKGGETAALERLDYYFF